MCLHVCVCVHGVCASMGRCVCMCEGAGWVTGQSGMRLKAEFQLEDSMDNV